MNRARAPRVRLHRTPPNPAVVRRYLWLCLVRFAAVGIIASAVFIFVVDDFPRTMLPFLAACVTATVSCALLVVISAMGLMNRPVPPLVLFAVGTWVVGLLAAFAATVAGEGGGWGAFVVGCVVMVAARPPLMLRNYLAALSSGRFPPRHGPR
ncbi:hypothetical protein [Actinomadura rubrisoli]|uniref:Uncharacterized protein n=1 Tax=Actinomadura rubrisoli TaxID=2530368 RepID=A0A4R5CBY1_9ACTN|nr:hypothetical protein [Actinomadura rubrisoli]TDD94644.1 hypothetical protein E1298_06585 [Actinomadura rubrisoli]